MKKHLIGLSAFDCLGDEELVRLTQNGSAEAFSPLVRKYQQKIYNLIYRKVRDPETAKDLCQVVFLKAWQALPNFKGQSTFYNWLYQIAVNCSIDFLRKQKRQVVLLCEELPENPDDTLQRVEPQSSPCQILEKKELAGIIREAIGQLSRNQRLVFHLRHRDGFSIREIASRLNKSEGTIKSHLYNAHQKLRKLLRPYLQNEPIGWYSGTQFQVEGRR